MGYIIPHSFGKIKYLSNDILKREYTEDMFQNIDIFYNFYFQRYIIVVVTTKILNKSQ
jgi:hypothetical protein